MLRNGRGRNNSRRIMIAVVAAMIPLVAGCEAGTNAPVLHWHQPTDGSGHAVGDIVIRNAFVLGAPIGRQLQAGQNAGLFFSLANNGNSNDRLLSITADGTAQSVALTGRPIVISNQSPVLLNGPQPQVILTNLTHPLAGGSVVSVTFDFKVAGMFTLKVPVMPRASYYATLLPAPAPTTPSGSPTPRGSASPNPSGSPSPSSS